MSSRSIRFVVCSISMLASLAFACGDGADDASDAQAAESSFFEDYAHAVCDDAGPCCAQAHYSYDAAKCRTAVASSIRKYLTEGYAGEIFNANKGAELVAKTKQMVTSCSEPAYGSPDAKALALLLTTLYTPTGNSAPGSECATQNDCAPIAGARTSCHFTITGDEDAKGRCKVYRPAAQGMSCAEDAVDLGNCDFDDFTGTGDGFYCDRSDYTCRARIPRGGACLDGTDVCASGSRCLDGTCQPLGAASERCSQDSDCASSLRCDQSSCVALKLGGETCEDAGECFSSRCSEGRCAAISVLTAAACRGDAQ